MKLSDIKLTESVSSSQLYDLVVKYVYQGQISDSEFRQQIINVAKQANSREEFIQAYNNIPEGDFEVPEDKAEMFDRINDIVKNVFDHNKSENDVVDEDLANDAVNAAMEVVQTNKGVKTSKQLERTMRKVAEIISSQY